MKIFKRNNKILVFTFFILLLNVACEKETEYEVLSGQLIGYVTLYDSDRTKLSDSGGVEVIVEGSNPQIKASTDEDGQFKIDNLKSGIYNIVFNKEGYCQHKIISYQFVGGNKPSTIYQTALYSQSNFQIDSLKITDLERQYTVEFMVNAKISNQKENLSSYCRYYLSNEPDISYKKYISTDIAYRFSGDEDISFYIRIDTLKFPIGSELYLIMYPTSETYQNYTDINTGNKIYTSINSNKPSEVATITIPEVEAPWWLD
ncbi:MAG: carboxypeptidase-like regulatory domain-containing protein [Bacteroidota bacterium]|nr:carboxypeptidase-like regulatory domain-containing protein [Bacteroidota bacterium]